MAEGAGGIRAAVVTFFPMFIATLSLLTAIFNGYLNSRFLDVIERNLGRGEYMRTCKDAIDAYFQVKAKAAVIHARTHAGGAAEEMSPELAAGLAAVSHFAALGTYLANLRDDAVRARYTELSDRLQKIVHAAGKPGADLNGLFAPADQLFGEMNDDCIRSAKAAPM